MRYKFIMIVVLLIMLHPPMVFSATPNSQGRIGTIKKILNKHILDTGVDIKQIFQEVSEQMPLDPVETPEYMNWKKKKEEIVKNSFSMTDQQLRESLSKKAEKHHPLHKIGDTVTINYLLARKLYSITGTYYRKTDRIIYIGSSKILRRTIPEEFACQFDESKTAYLREKYIKNGIQSYHKRKKDFEDQIFKNEIMQSQGYLKVSSRWLSARELIQFELKRIAEEKGITIEQMIKGTPAEVADVPPPPEVKFNEEYTILIKYPADAPNKYYKIPESVEVIGEKAFENCKNLEKVHVPQKTSMIGNSAFKGCENLSAINLPASIRRIGKEAFADCKNLKSIILPKQIDTIPFGCFSSSGLETITLHGNIQTIEIFALSNDKLKKIVIPASVRIIEDGAFCGSAAIIQADNNAVFQTDRYGVLFNKDKKRIIYAPNNLTVYEIPASTKEIGNFAFAKSKLEKIYIPRQVKSIGHSAFASCKKLKSVSCSYGVTDIGPSAFSGSGLKKVILPDSITNIGNAAFSYCADLEEISFPKKITILEWAVCANCDNLRKVSVSPTLSIIKGRAFYDCKKLTEINLPKTLVSVEKGAFNGAPVAKQVESLMLDTFRIPGTILTFNWNYTLKNYRSLGFNMRYLGSGGNIEEYILSDGYAVFRCLKYTNQASPFCFVFDGNIAKSATMDIADTLKNPDKKFDYLRIKTFDSEKFDQGLSEQTAIVFCSSSFKVLLQFDRKDTPKMVIYKVDDDNDEQYYRMLHYKGQ